MKTIKQSYLVHAPLSDVWEALVDSKHIEKWGGGPATMDSKVGTEFSLWGGSIWGRNVKLVFEKELVQEWYSDEKPKWTSPSIVKLMLSAERKDTKIELLHTNVPDENAKDIEDGWKSYYLGPLKEYVENNHK